MRLVSLGIAAAAVTAAIAVPASADPIPYPPPPIGVGQCTIWWYEVPITTSDSPVKVYAPRCIW
jgi:hypothetical protein